MLNNAFTDQHLSDICKLIDVISPTAELAKRHREELLRSDPDDAEPEDPSDLLWLLKDVVDWETGYFVDWKDTESFVQCVTKMAASWGATVTYGVDNALEDEVLDVLSVPDLMIRAHGELLAQGLVLWSWDTEGDCYAGWITRVADRATVKSLLESWGVEVREGDQPF